MTENVTKGLRDRGRVDREVEAGRERLTDRVDIGGGRETEAERQREN